MAEAKPGGGGGGGGEGGRGDPGLPPPRGPWSGGGGEPPPAAPCLAVPCRPGTAAPGPAWPSLAPGVPAAPARPPPLTLVYLLRCLARPQTPSSPATGTPRRPSLPPPPAGLGGGRRGGGCPGRQTATASGRPGPAPLRSPNPRRALSHRHLPAPCSVSQAPGRHRLRRPTPAAAGRAGTPRERSPLPEPSGGRAWLGLGNAAPTSIICVWLHFWWLQGVSLSTPQPPGPVPLQTTAPFLSASAAPGFLGQPPHGGVELQPTPGNDNPC